MHLGSLAAGIAAVRVNACDRKSSGHEPTARMIFEATGGFFWEMPNRAVLLVVGERPKIALHALH
ncbi:hypothetical protein C1I98_25630 [Spongiactinospora gelatinilytica]|uniref:Uncharacterized protein n=1 Tax=Spongiactinospora gelatinilytica TaxID=2666298 RepID=A0A2W2GAS1_9ACTN|nr:hypothetical protein C1I98_25630 [Spongiactinospora gelatinilytica]